MAYKTNNLEGDTIIGRHLHIGGEVAQQGSSHIKGNLKVDGWLFAYNVQGANKGLFQTEAKLKEAFPSPQDGWWAIVGNTLPGPIYAASGGVWADTGQEGGEPILDNPYFEEEIEELRGDVMALQEDVGDIKNKFLGLGYTYVGTATPTTTPMEITEEDKVFYIAIEAGDYTAFGQSTITNLTVLKSVNNSWVADKLNIPIVNIPLYSSADFANNNFIIGDVGTAARVNPIQNNAYIRSDAYRCFWVRVNEGDVINTYTLGYADNISIGFSPTKTLVDMTVIAANYAHTNRSATAPSDGYFFVGLVYKSGGNILDNKVWIVPKIVVLDAPLYDSDYFKNDKIVGDVGAKFRVTPEKTIFKSDFYRCFWVKVNEGDVINTYTQGYADNISIAFSPTKTLDDLTNIIADNGRMSRSATAPSDGYFFVGLIYKLGGVILDNKVWIAKSDSITIDLAEGDALYSFFGNASGVVVGDEKVITAPTSQTSLVYKVKKGDVISADIRQFIDTAAVAFSTTEPQVGTTVLVLDIGDRDLESKYVMGTAPDDGYIMLTYYNPVTNAIANIKKMASVQSYIESRLDSIENTLDSSSLVDFRNTIHFTAAPMPAASEITINGKTPDQWKCNDVIDFYDSMMKEYPQYIKKRNLGKDASGTYDIWLYEFNNSVDEWFNINNTSYFISVVVRPGENGLTEYQCGIGKEVYDNFVNTKNGNVYFHVGDSPSPRQLEMPISTTEQVINGTTYYIMTFSKKLILREDTGIGVWWTEKVNTFDQHGMIIAGIHGTEISGYVGTALALKYLIEHHEENPSLDYIFNHVKLSIVPIVNVWGTSQSTIVNNNCDGTNLSNWTNYTAEHKAIDDYVKAVKDELSFFLDFHTSEFWENYGYVYAITYPHSPLYPAMVSTANFLCKHWFPLSPPYNWNVGGKDNSTSGSVYAQVFMQKNYGITGAIVEFNGLDLLRYGGFEKWSDKYMTFMVENYLNFIIATCCIRVKNNSKAIIESDVFDKYTMV